jgi:hypothetical protein
MCITHPNSIPLYLYTSIRLPGLRYFRGRPVYNGGAQKKVIDTIIHVSQ